MSKGTGLLGDVGELLLAGTVGELAEALMRAADPVERPDLRVER